MPFIVPIDQVAKDFTEYTIISALTPSEQKAAFHVIDKNGQHLCLKIIAPTYSLDRIDREITALQLLSNINVVKLIEYTYSTKQGIQRHYMVEEFIEGDDLESLLPPKRKWDLPASIKLFIKLTNGLESLRIINLVHRDLKPNNIRIRPNDSPVIIDFGLVRHLSLPDLTKTSEGAAIGTPLYFSPEQFLGNKHDIDHRTDLFALGIMMYQLFVGCHPFAKDGMSYADLQNAVCNSIEYLNNDNYHALPRPIQILIRQLLSKQRAGRPQSAGQVSTILSKLGV